MRLQAGSPQHRNPTARSSQIPSAEVSGAQFLITEDVDDFAEEDLVGLGISAVNPDLFLSLRLTRDEYSSVIDLFVRGQVAPPTTPAGFHSAIARQHPRLFSAHADLYAMEPMTSTHMPPSALIRGDQLSLHSLRAE